MFKYEDGWLTSKFLSSRCVIEDFIFRRVPPNNFVNNSTQNQDTRTASYVFEETSVNGHREKHIGYRAVKLLVRNLMKQL